MSDVQNVTTWHEFTTWLSTRSSWTDSSTGALHLLVQHVVISAASLGLAVAIGLPLALVLSRFGRGGLLVSSVANAARAVPIVGIMILLAVGPLGVGRSAAVVALVIFAIPPVLTNAYTGLVSVDRDVSDAAIGMGMSRRQVATKVELPLAIPLIAGGIRLAAFQIWATATIAAIVSSGGLGEIIVDGYSVNDHGEVWAGVLVIVVTALALDGTLALVQRWLRRRYGDNASVVAGRDRNVISGVAETVGAS